MRLFILIAVFAYSLAIAIEVSADGHATIPASMTDTYTKEKNGEVAYLLHHDYTDAKFSADKEACGYGKGAWFAAGPVIFVAAVTVFQSISIADAKHKALECMRAKGYTPLYLIELPKSGKQGTDKD